MPDIKTETITITVNPAAAFGLGSLISYFGAEVSGKIAHPKMQKLAVGGFTTSGVGFALAGVTYLAFGEVRRQLDMYHRDE